MRIISATFDLSVALLLSCFVNHVMRTNTLKKRKDFYQVQDITVSSVLFALQGVLPCPVGQGEAWNFLAVQDRTGLTGRVS